MHENTLRTDIDDAVAARPLLTHPFYVRWQQGDVTRAELSAYAAQYRHFEAAFPDHLRGIIERVEDATARDLIGRNLADEAGGPVTHVQLFDDFAAALGASTDVEPTSATRHLLDTYTELVTAGPMQGLAAVIAYEVQFPAVAAAKAEGLRRDHGMAAAATAFWDLHAELDNEHAAWGIEALGMMSGDAAVVAGAARSATDAWWSFLDERESEGTKSV